MNKLKKTKNSLGKIFFDVPNKLDQKIYLNDGIKIIWYNYIFFLSHFFSNQIKKKKITFPFQLNIKIYLKQYFYFYNINKQFIIQKQKYLFINYISSH